MKVWASVAYTESGDEYINVFSYKPTKIDIDTVFKAELGEEFDYVSSTTTTECVLIEA